MTETDVKMERIANAVQRLKQLTPVTYYGYVRAIRAGIISVSGLNAHASVGDRVRISLQSGHIGGEIVGLRQSVAEILPEGEPEGLSIGAGVELLFAPRISPDDSWIGRVIDPFGSPLDGRPLLRGDAARPFRREAVSAINRKRMGERLGTGLAVFDTLLPLARGQRIGLFAGSGVGKSRLLSRLARGVDAEIVVIAQIGERGRELREFVENTLGPEGMKRAIIVAATSDRSPLIRRRCAWAAMAVAEYFRDQGRHVLLLADSITRFAEAHREIALAAGEPPSYRGFPPSVSNMIMSLAERAGPGEEGKGDITAIFTVLVAGSDMEEPVADILRGTLDGHVVLDRAIAERGRFPAVDVVRSVSRALPEAANGKENAVIAHARKLLGAYAESELMIRSGLYAPGSDPLLDEAVRLFPRLDAFITETSSSVPESFTALADALRTPGALNRR